MKQHYNQRFVTLLFCFFIVSLTAIKAQEISIFDIARKGTLEQLKEEVKKDSSSINRVSEKGYSALTLACYYANSDVAKYLINHVKDINSKSAYGTPLMASVVKNNKELVELLLKNKANPNAIDQNGSTALHYAVMFGYIDIIKLLANAKANSSLKDNRGKTALDYAKLTANPKIINILNN